LWESDGTWISHNKFTLVNKSDVEMNISTQ
jgi:hypothetical protein